MTLNLKHPDAGAVYADLAKKSDIVVENFSRGTLDRLGVGYAFAREVNPKVVYCSITGFGGCKFRESDGRHYSSPERHDDDFRRT